MLAGGLDDLPVRPDVSAPIPHVSAVADEKILSDPRYGREYLTTLGQPQPASRQPSPERPTTLTQLIAIFFD